MMQDDYHRPRQTAQTCWWCGRCAPSGVCAGPHPDYAHHTHRTAGHVEGVRRPGAIRVKGDPRFPPWQ